VFCILACIVKLATNWKLPCLLLVFIHVLLLCLGLAGLLSSTLGAGSRMAPGDDGYGELVL
jgi:hypothetical protein